MAALAFAGVTGVSIASCAMLPAECDKLRTARI
jgi:hypothetical protein